MERRFVTPQGYSTTMPSQLTSQEAIQLTANFAITADKMRSTDDAFEIRAQLCDTASRVAFLRAHLLAEREEIFPMIGEIFRRAVFAVV